MNVREDSPGTTHHVPHPEPKKAAGAAGSGPLCRRGEALGAAPPGEGSQERQGGRNLAGKARESAGGVPGSGTPSTRAGRPVMSHGGEKAGGRGKRLQDGGKPDPREGSGQTGRPRPRAGRGSGALSTLPSPPPSATGAAAGSRPQGLRAGGAGAAARSHDRRGAGRGRAGPHVRAAPPPRPSRAPRRQIGRAHV